MTRNPSRLTIIGKFMQRKLVKITTDEGWVPKGIINTITQEDSGNPIRVGAKLGQECSVLVALSTSLLFFASA